MKRILRNKWFWVLAVLVATGLFVIWIGWPKHYDLTVSYETTRLTGPLFPDGTVNYVAALNEMYGEGVTPDNNAAILLLQAFGPEMLDDRVRSVTLKRLGVPPLSPDAIVFRPLYDLIEEELEKNAPPETAEEDPPNYAAMAQAELRAVGSAPWQAADHPAVVAALEANERPLALIVAAARRPRHYLPTLSPDEPPTVFSSIIPSMGKYLRAADALVARTMLRAGRGRIEQAMDDLLAAHRLGRLVGQQPYLIARLVGIAVEQIACEGSITLATSGKLSAAQAKAFLARLQDLPPLPGVTEGIDQCERYMNLDIVGFLARASWKRGFFGRSEGDDDELTEGRTINADWDKMLRNFNHWYDMQADAMRQPTFQMRVQALAKFDAAMQKYVAR